MTELWTDDAPGERRAALIENGKVVEIHMQRDLLPVLGEQGLGRIDRKTLSGSYVIGDEGHEILIRGKIEQPEGVQISYEVTREGIAEPGRVKPAEAKQIYVTPTPTYKDAIWSQRLLDFGPRPKSVTVDEIFGDALAGTSHVGDIGVHFQRTKAGLVFDIDGIGDPFVINNFAAKEIARLLRLFQVGGMAVIDFLALDSKIQRQEIAEIFDSASALDRRPFERSAINGFGMMQVVRSRQRPSVLDHLFGTHISSLSTETKALWLLRETAKSAGFGVRQITASSKVASLMLSPTWEKLRATCERICGAPVVIIVDEKVTGYGHVHVAQS